VSPGLADQDTGLVRFGARDYEPRTGTWASKDALKFGGGLNFYAYCANDPVNLIDRVGLGPDDPAYWENFQASYEAAEAEAPGSTHTIAAVGAAIGLAAMSGPMVALAVDVVGGMCGGAASSGAVTVTEEGLEAVTNHLAQFGSEPHNEAMLSRLASQLGSELTGARSLPTNMRPRFVEFSEPRSETTSAVLAC
jgi:RHS repeat-associated protein